MVQVENEIGMLPIARERGAVADKRVRGAGADGAHACAGARGEKLEPELRERWQKHGAKTSGTWAQVFGDDEWGAEVFTAWHYARFVEALVGAAKKRYDIPMYVNAALNRTGRKPGEYPSGGPLPHLLDVWKAGAPSLDFWRPTSTSRTSRSSRRASIAPTTCCSFPRPTTRRIRRVLRTRFIRSASSIRWASRRSRSSRWAMRRMRCRARTRCSSS